MLDLKSQILIIPNWPKPGIDTYDLGPLLRDKDLFAEVINQMAAPYQGQNITAFVGLEARGFVLAAALAQKLNSGIVLIRKKGKLPPPTVAQEYSYEYASNIIEIQANSLKAGDRVVLVDDILATGGTMSAALKLIKKLDVTVVGISFVLEMEFMAGRTRLKDQIVHSLITY